MKNKILKTFLFFVLFSTLLITASFAVEIKEDVADYESDVYIIGSTRFDANQTITATMAANAGINEAKVQLALGNDISKLNVTIYFFDAIFGDWYEINKAAKAELIEESTEIAKIEKDLNIFFVENEEKVLEVPYSGTVDEGTIWSPEDNVIFEDGVFKVPVLTRHFSFLSNDVANNVETNIIESVLNGEDLVENVEIIPQWAAFEANGKYYSVDSIDEMLASANELEIKLVQGVDLKTAILVDKKITLDLNGYFLTVREDIAGDGVFHVVEGGDLTINGEGIVDGVGNNKWNIVVFADGGNVTINGGTYTNLNTEILEEDTDSDHFDVIYAKGNGKVTINGGYFEGKTPAWLLNLHDGSRETASITVKGGIFSGLNPANSAAEGKGTNFVAEGYKVVAYQNEYVVEPITESDVILADGMAYADLQTAVNTASNVKLLKDIDLPTAVEVSNKVTIDLNNCDLTVTQDTVGDGVFHVIEGGDLTINGDGMVNGVGNNIWNIVIFADGGHVTINGGTYTNTNIVVSEDDTDSDHFDVIYAKGNGTVEINGGRFEGKTPAWLLNLHDGSRTTASITVKGGTFVGFDPSNNAAEGAGTNFVAEGYTVNNNDNVYTVKGN